MARISEATGLATELGQITTAQANTIMAVTTNRIAVPAIIEDLASTS
ncbi:hypothetical protein [Rubritalea sp.]